MTPAIQIQNAMPARQTAAEARSINLTHIFKKMVPFPQKMSRPALIVAIDLGVLKWQVAFLSGLKTRFRTITGTDKRFRLMEAVTEEMERLGLEDTLDVVFCYEIGRDGLWPRDWATANGFPCIVLSSDVLSSGSGKTVKTDRVDARSLAVRLGRFFDGDLECDHVHLPPSRDVLAGRAVSRGRKDAQELRTQLCNKFKAILARYTEVPPGLDVRKAVPSNLRDALGRPLPPEEVVRLERLRRHFLEMDRDVAEDDRRMRDACKAARKAADAGLPLLRREEMLALLTRVKGISFRLAWLLVHELFFKEFRNTRQVGSATGLVAVPRCSGSSERCAGISRRSNNRLRGALVELGWIWLRHQPDSELAQWFGRRTAAGISARRMRKVAVVAVARKLAVALWKYLARGPAPQGAVLKAE